MKAIAVIGAAFGDEGKGLMTDYFAEPGDLIIRYNGGAQAGHTVQTPLGQRHVFSHIGSGTFQNADTYLSRFFILNPLLWKKELSQLKDIKPKIYVDWNALLSTPYDMALNQEVEKQRDNKHGSCGLGINETVTRCRDANFSTIAAFLLRPASLRDRLLKIQNEYWPKRTKELGISSELPDYLNQQMIDSYMKICLEFWEKTSFTSISGLRDIEWNKIIFEGAQGLLLDENHKFFPHVTRSRTGIPNISELIRKLNIDKLCVVYVLRSYMTRHGRGPFPTEDKMLRFEDTTNVHNDFQESLRFGKLDLSLIKEAIHADLDYDKGLKIKTTLAMTHLDQFEDIDFAKKAQKYLCLDNLIVSSGSTKNDVSLICNKVYQCQS